MAYPSIATRGGLIAERKYWLFKSEPTAYSFDDLLNEENQTAEWDGVRNYQVRNFMRDEMREGDAVLFYHSSTNPTAVVGTATIVTQAYPDVTAWDPRRPGNVSRQRRLGARRCGSPQGGGVLSQR